jgi:poly(ADP-ribose) glycohydrolase ARH3
MSTSSNDLNDRFRGCLLGLAIGDALGGLFEGQDAYAIRDRFANHRELIHYPQDELWYTDDTQMTIIGVAHASTRAGNRRGSGVGSCRRSGTPAWPVRP